MGTTPDTLSVRTADNVAVGFNTAGVGSRLSAQLVDGLVVGALLLVTYTALGAAVASLQGRTAAALIAGLYVAATFLVICGYRSPQTNAWMHAHSSGVAARSSSGR